MGVFQLAMPYYSILASVSLSGITVAVSRLTVEKTTVGEEYKTQAVVQTALRLFLILLAACTVITFLFPDLVAGKILGDIRTRASMLLFIPCLFLTGFENIYKSFFYGAKHIKPNIISEPTELIIRIISVFILLYINKDNLTPEKTAFIMVSAMIISEIFSFIFLGAYYKIYQGKRRRIIRRSGGSARLSYIKSKGILPEISRIAVPICASSVLMTIISSVNTILIPKRLVVSGMTHTQAIETLGILMGMSMPLVTLPVIFIGPLMNVVLPRIASAKKLGDSADLNKKIAKTIKTCSFLTFPAMAAVGARC
jgi:O-antigen/teichoic acid export membrane protein